MSANFIWRDAGRTVVFRQEGLAQASALLGEHGIASFELLTTARAVTGASQLAAAAARAHELAPGGVPESAAALLDSVRSSHLVALGGGRVIDTAKAIASVSGASVIAIATTMSGAEMTGIHRLPSGAEARAQGLIRPALVIADPVLMTSQPEPELRASSINALAHAADSLYTPFANPISRMSALRGAELIATSLDQVPIERDRGALALGSILSGYAIDSALFAIHHVICQTLVRICGARHAETNAAILPRAMGFMASRAPDQLSQLAAAIGTEPGDIESRILSLGGNPSGLGAAGAERSGLEQALEAILARPELAFTPHPPDRGELRQLIESAW